MGNRHWSRGEALRHPLIWCLMPLILAAPCFMTAVFFHQVHLAAAKGLAHVQFVSVLPLYTGCVIVTVLTSGALIDRFGARRLIALAQLPFIAGFLLLSQTAGLGGLAAAMICLGIGAGGMNTISTATWAEAYGTAHIGAIKALATSVAVFGSALGPALTGWAIDAGTPLTLQMPLIAGWFATAALLAAAALRHFLR